MVPVMGRALLGIAGAYLLRATAESGVVPQVAAVVAATIYGACWLASSGRMRSASRFTTAAYALTAALVISPMLWETTVRFRVLPAPATAAILVLFVMFGAALAWSRNVAIISWIATLAGAATGLALIAATREVVTFSAAILAMAIIVEYAACRDHWLGERWPVAVIADIAVFLLAYVATRADGPPEGYAAVSAPLATAFQFALFGIYAGSTICRTLARGLDITWFEVVQCAAALSMLGFSVFNRTRFGFISAALAVICYFVAFRAARKRNLHAYSLFGFALTTVALVQLCNGIPLVGFASAAAITTTLLRRAVQLYTAAFLIVAAMAAHAPMQLAGTIIIAVVCLICFLAQHQQLRRGGDPRPFAQLISFLVAGVFSWSVLDLSSFAAAPFGPAIVASTRTAVVCVLALALAWSGQRTGRRELVWMLGPLMLFGAGKILLEEFQQGTPAAVAVSLLFYGGALILTPRLVRNTPQKTCIPETGVTAVDGTATRNDARLRLAEPRP
jgi:hypothetical protein